MSRVYDALRRIRRDLKTSPDAPSSPLEYVSYRNGTDSASGVSTSEKSACWDGAEAADPTSEGAQDTTPFAVDCRNVTITWNPRLPVLPNSATKSVLEQYKRLRTKILQLRDSSHIALLLVTSPGPREGKTLTVANLTLAFAMLPSFRVLAVDADLRRRSLATTLGLQDEVGLANVLDGSCSLNDALVRCKATGAHYLPAGRSQVPAAELLHSPQLAIQFARLTSAFDLILIDSPPANVITDTELLATHCDAALVVARVLGTTCKAFEQMVETLRGCRVIGAVLNGTAPVQRYHSYQAYYE